MHLAEFKGALWTIFSQRCPWKGCLAVAMVPTADVIQEVLQDVRGVPVNGDQPGLWALLLVSLLFREIRWGWRNGFLCSEQRRTVSLRAVEGICEAQDRVWKLVERAWKSSLQQVWYVAMSQGSLMLKTRQELAFVHHWPTCRYGTYRFNEEATGVIWHLWFLD